MARQGPGVDNRLCGTFSQNDPARLASVLHTPPAVGRCGSGDCKVQAEEVPEPDDARRRSGDRRFVPDPLAIPPRFAADYTPDRGVAPWLLKILAGR
eukprot:12546974-Alexandrium_andersonii.AAC.1